MSTVPWAADSIPNLHVLLPRTHGDNITNSLMTWDQRASRRSNVRLLLLCVGSTDVQWGTVGLRLRKRIGVADTAGEDLDEDLAFLRVLGLDLFDNQRSTLLLEEGGLVGLGDFWSHADS